MKDGGWGGGTWGSGGKRGMEQGRVCTFLRGWCRRDRGGMRCMQGESMNREHSHPHVNIYNVRSLSADKPVSRRPQSSQSYQMYKYQ